MVVTSLTPFPVGSSASYVSRFAPDGGTCPVTFETCPLQHELALKGKDREVSRGSVISLALWVTGIRGYLRDVIE